MLRNTGKNMNPKKGFRRSVTLQFDAPKNCLKRLGPLLKKYLENSLTVEGLELKNCSNGLRLDVNLEEDSIDTFLTLISKIIFEAESLVASCQGIDLVVMDKDVSESPFEKSEAHLAGNWKVRFCDGNLGQEDLAQKGSSTIYIRPSLNVFGSGIHPSTRLAATALILMAEREPLPFDMVIDVGTGSGILAILAAHLGAKQIIAQDIQKDAIANAMDNLRLNMVDERVTLLLEPLSKLPYLNSDVIVANLTPSVMFRELEAMTSRLDSRGRLILSGHSLKSRDTVCQKLKNYGMDMEEGLDQDGWSAEIFRFRR